MFLWTISAAGSPCAAGSRRDPVPRHRSRRSTACSRIRASSAVSCRTLAGCRRRATNGSKRSARGSRGPACPQPAADAPASDLHPRPTGKPDQRAPEKQLTLREAVAFLVDREVARRNERRLGMAHFPAVRELAGFDFKAQPSVDKRHIRDLATVSLGGARRLGLVPRSARGREVASRHSLGARGRPPRLLGAVRDGPGGDGVAGQGARQGRSRALSS